MYEPGQIVKIAYTGYWIEAKILREATPVGFNYWEVEQITDYEDVPEGERPVFAACEEYISRQDEELKPGPFTPDWFRKIRDELDSGS